MSYDDLVVGGFNFNQLLISSIDTLKATALEKCIEADKMLVEIYQSILALNQETKFESNLNRLTQASEQNEMLVSKYTAEKEINPLY